jgi:hypothetical protein
MQHLKIRLERLIEDFQVLSTSPRQKMKRAQKKIEERRSGFSAGSLDRIGYVKSTSNRFLASWLSELV